MMQKLAAVGAAVLIAGVAAAETLTVTRVNGRVTVDGVLDEPAWENVPPVELLYETSPGNNVAAPVRTEAFLAYDDEHLYVAFRAWDPDASKIRAHYSDRDFGAVHDDFAGIIIDTFNDERRAFEFFATPLGVQIDAVNNDVGGGEDLTWDAIWASAGKLLPDGYVVEMAIPFRALRFRQSNTEQTWGVDLVRIYPRDQRRRIGLHPISKDRNCYLCQASKMTGFAGIPPGLNLELTPTVTAQQTRAREGFPSGAFQGTGTEIEPGLTARWGATPNITISAALHPDFSQVEADAAQLDVNRQFALFFEEKRPFFLEGADFFETPLDIVYTRTVADPSWGLKVTGKQDRHGLGIFVAGDATTNLLIPGSEGSSLTSLDQDNRSAAFRYRYDVGSASTIGILLTDRSGASYENRVGGVDGFFRVGARDTISAQFLRSETRDPFIGEQSGSSIRDGAYLVRYRHNSRNWFWSGAYVDLGTGFRADSGFLPQVDFRQLSGAIERTWWADSKRTWYSRYSVAGDWERSETQSGELLEDEIELRASVNGPMQSFFLVNVGHRDRSFNGRLFEEQYVSASAEVRPTGDIHVGITGRFGDQIDFANTRPGELFAVGSRLSWSLGRHLQLGVNHDYERLDVTEGRLYTANLSQLRAAYQFNVRTFVRLIAQYTDVSREPDLYRETVVPLSRRLFPQLLFSYKVNPQTVFFAGYTESRLGTDADPLTQNDQTLFVKLGYAWLR